MTGPFIGGEVVGVENVAANLQGAPERTLTALRDEIRILTNTLFVSVRDEYLTGRALKVQTGKARASVKHSIRTGRYSITGSVWSDYYILRFWEHGFKVKERNIESGKGPMSWTGAEHPTMSVHQAAREEAKRPSLAPALSEMSLRIVERIGPIALEAI